MQTTPRLFLLRLTVFAVVLLLIGMRQCRRETLQRTSVSVGFVTESGCPDAIRNRFTKYVIP
jgi:hypothetical protein